MTFESRVRLAMTGKRAPDIDVTRITKTDAMRRLVNRWSPPPLPQLLVSSELVPVGDATADDAAGMFADVVDMIRGPYRLFSFSPSRGRDPLFRRWRRQRRLRRRRLGWQKSRKVKLSRTLPVEQTSTGESAAKSEGGIINRGEKKVRDEGKGDRTAAVLTSGMVCCRDWGGPHCPTANRSCPRTRSIQMIGREPHQLPLPF